MKKFITCLIAVNILVLVSALHSTPRAQGAEPHPFADLNFRSIGPAIMGGRISDFAFHPTKRSVFYAATASAGLWKTTNNAITWTPVFDNETSFSIGIVELAPSNPNIVWVGSGENNSQRSVAYGDGVYRSLDAGKTWQNMGLGESEHISQIWIDPTDPNTVIVAATGPLWRDGGDRGLYKTTDGGLNWTKILETPANTGANEFVVDPRDHNVIVATTVQRRRHRWTLIGGGPNSGIFKTRDGGETWKEITTGVPSGDKGRIGLAMAQTQPDTIYAVLFAGDGGSGFYRSTDFGETWEKRSNRMSNDPQYYNEITVDPVKPDRIYLVDTFAMMSDDGGKTWDRLGLQARHVDDHAFWIDPADTDHIYLGGDGGIYESWDRGQTWRHVRNLPIMQFYRVQPDNAYPFYNVYGGTQDASSYGGPSRTTFIHGIANSDWRILQGGDGFEPQIDPTDSNIVYAQAQHAALVRYDWRTTERVNIVPQPESGETEYNWNWATPLIISPHDPKRLYMAAKQVFRSDDRGNNWRIISPDLTRGIDRNTLPVMGRVWSVDALQKNGGTSRYGAAIGLSESELQEGLIYLSMDDGRINVTEDGGETWRGTNRVGNAPDMSYVGDIVASVHDVDVAYATVSNHKRADFKPYVMRSDDRGRTWRNISGDLPVRGSSHTIVEDHVDPNLLFVGTEFGIWFTQNRGRNWHRLKGNFPTISVRDLEIQRRESDLVVASFGRSFYILDDYSPLRTPMAEIASADATFFPVKDALLYVPGDKWQMGQALGTVGTQGMAFFHTDNPPFGAIFTYSLNDDIRSRRETRRKAEKARQAEGGDNPYPSWDALRAEDREPSPALFFVVKDSNGDVVRRVTAPTRKGLHRVAWDLRYPAPDPVDFEEGFRAPGAAQPWDRWYYPATIP